MVCGRRSYDDYDAEDAWELDNPGPALDERQTPAQQRRRHDLAYRLFSTAALSLELLASSLHYGELAGDQVTPRELDEAIRRLRCLAERAGRRLKELDSREAGGKGHETRRSYGAHDPATRKYRARAAALVED